MTESVKEILRKFLIDHPGKCFSGFELVEENKRGKMLHYDGTKLDASERSFCNRAYELTLEKDSGITSRKRIVNGDKKAYNEYAFNMSNQGDLI